jgi:hypothetical protein
MEKNTALVHRRGSSKQIGGKCQLNATELCRFDSRGKGNRLPLQTVEMMNLRKDYGHE